MRLSAQNVGGLQTVVNFPWDGATQSTCYRLFASGTRTRCSNAYTTVAYGTDHAHSLARHFPLGGCIVHSEGGAGKLRNRPEEGSAPSEVQCVERHDGEAAAMERGLREPFRFTFEQTPFHPARPLSAGLIWQWEIDHALNTNSSSDMGTGKSAYNGATAPVTDPIIYDIDGFDNPASTVAALHGMGPSTVASLLLAFGAASADAQAASVTATFIWNGPASTSIVFAPTSPCSGTQSGNSISVTCTGPLTTGSSWVHSPWLDRSRPLLTPYNVVGFREEGNRARSRRIDSNCEPLSDVFVNFSQLKPEARRSAMDRIGWGPVASCDGIC